MPKRKQEHPKDLQGRPRILSYLPGEPVPHPAPTSEEWKALYEAGQRFKDMAPWTWMDDTQLIGVTDPSGGATGWCVVMGALKESFGLWVYRDADGFAAYDAMARGDDLEFDTVALFNYLSLSFEDRRELTGHDLDLLKLAGLKPKGRNQWPMFRAKDPWYLPRTPDAQEATFMMDVIEQVTVKADQLREDPATPLRKGRKLLVRRRDTLDGQQVWSDSWVPRPEAMCEIPRVPIDEVEVARIKRQIPASEELWDLDVFPLEAAIRDEQGWGTYFYPPTLLMVTWDGGLVIHTELFAPGPKIWESVITSMLRGVCNARRLPRGMAVGRKILLHTLQPVCTALGVELLLAERLVLLPAARLAMEEHLSSGPR